MNRRTRSGAASAPIELLEPRRMLATFTGTSGNDTIVISVQAGGGSTIVQMNGVNNLTADASITINAGAGNDLFRVFNTRNNTTIIARGEAGDDTLENVVADLDDVFDAAFTFDGGSGADTVFADNGTDTADGASFRIQGDGILRESPDTFLLRYGQLESIVFADNDNANTIRHVGLRSATSNIVNLTINAHGGDDRITNSPAGGTGSWGTSVGTGLLHIDGGPGSNEITSNNQSDAGGATYTVNSTGVTVNSPLYTAGTMTFTNCRLSLFASDHADVVAIPNSLSFASASFVSVSGAGGNDLFTVGGGDIDSNGFTSDRMFVSGGVGIDSVLFDDRLDVEGEVEQYTVFQTNFGTWSVRKGTTAGVSFGGDFENLTLAAADRASATPAPNAITISDFHDSFFNTAVFTVDAPGTIRQNVISVAAQTPSSGPNQFQDTITLNAPGAAVTINGLSITGGTYTAGKTQFSRAGGNRVINYVGVGSIALNTSSAGDTIDVNGVQAGASLTVNAGAGDDTVTLGAGNVDADLLGPVTFDGGPGTDIGTVDNTSDASVESHTLNGSTFTDAIPHNVFVERLFINEGPGGTSLTVNATAGLTEIEGGTGNDTFTVGGGDINSNFQPTAGMGLRLDAGSGNDQILINDLNDNTLDRYVFQRPGGLDQLVKDGTSNDYFISWTGVESVSLEANNAPASPLAPCDIVVTDTLTPLRIKANAGSDRITIADAGVPLFVHTGLGDADVLIVNSDFTPGDTPVTVVMDQSDDVETLDIRSAGTVHVTAGATLTKTRLGAPAGVLNIAGVLDLAGGAFISRAGGPTVATFQSLLVPGFNSGSWNGTSASGAINSSVAASSPVRDGVGYGLGSEVAVGALGGFLIQPGDVLLRYTLDGDANLDARVNLQDFNRLAGNFGAAGRRWVNGDFDFDGAVNLRDFNALAGNFGLAAAAPTTSSTRGSILDLSDGAEMNELLDGLS